MVDNESQQYSIEHDNFTFNDKSRLNITTKNVDKEKVPPGFENIVRRNINVLDNRRLSWYIDGFFLFLKDFTCHSDRKKYFLIGIPLKTKL